MFSSNGGALLLRTFQPNRHPLLKGPHIMSLKLPSGRMIQPDVVIVWPNILRQNGIAVVIDSTVMQIL